VRCRICFLTGNWEQAGNDQGIGKGLVRATSTPFICFGGDEEGGRRLTRLHQGKTFGD
jgi:hypothetical protein